MVSVEQASVAIEDTDDIEDDFLPAKVRRLNRVQRIRHVLKSTQKHSQNASHLDITKPGDDLLISAGLSTTTEAQKGLKQTLLATSKQLRQEAEKTQANTEEQVLNKIIEEEKQILNQIQLSMNIPLLGVRERAFGITYTEPLKRSWTLPTKYAKMTQLEGDKLRDEFYIDVSGRNVPPPILKFNEMRLPKCILQALKRRDIKQPTQIQMQGIPIVLQGRDLIGIAFTGSGKTIVFVLPMVLEAMKAELQAPFFPGEGPSGLVICPSRELAVQTYNTVEYFCEAMAKDGFPRLRNVCMIGGTSVSHQSQKVRMGAHLVIATPGRLNDMLQKKRMSLAQCTLLVLDEADRLVDLGFEEDVRNALDYFQHQRQTVLFSATMPRKIQEFARNALIDPITVNVGRAGAANLDVVQEVDYVKQDEKLPYLVECLQKTVPPVVIFCENRKSVDDVHEYLLLKGIDAVAIHAGLSQDERQEAIEDFRNGKRDVLIGTDVASKGLDFPDIQHVINFDMPKEIENYVHRIGRTGRCGNIGIATTFINKNQDEGVLIDLKALLLEAGQKIPPFLEALHAPSYHGKEIGGVRGCAFCSGLGHRIAQCPKLENQKSKQSSLIGGKNDILTTSSRYGGTLGYGGEW